MGHWVYVEDKDFAFKSDKELSFLEREIIEKRKEAYREKHQHDNNKSNINHSLDLLIAPLEAELRTAEFQGDYNRAKSAAFDIEMKRKCYR